MNLFELPRFNWWKNMEQIMENVNLSEFSMLQNNHQIITFPRAVLRVIRETTSGWQHIDH